LELEKQNGHGRGKIKVRFEAGCRKVEILPRRFMAMNTNDNELRRMLEDLHRKIEDMDEVDEKGRELLSHLSVDIRKLLERTGHEEQLRGTSWEIGRLQESIRHFEVTHPKLTAALSHLLNTLSNAGI
jgi:hypothetical protein